MESNWHGKRTPPDLPAIAHMLYHRGQVGFQVVKKPRDLLQPTVQCVEAGRSCWLVADSGRAFRPWLAAVEHGGQVLRMLAKGYGQRFQSPRTAPALDSMPLDFPDDRRRHMRTLGQFAPAPAELGHPVVNCLGDCRPVLRHQSSALRPGAEISPCPAFGVAAQRFLRLGSENRSLTAAEISDMSMKSALRVLGVLLTSLWFPNGKQV